MIDQQAYAHLAESIINSQNFNDFSFPITHFEVESKIDKFLISIFNEPLELLNLFPILFQLPFHILIDDSWHAFNIYSITINIFASILLFLLLRAILPEDKNIALITMLIVILNPYFFYFSFIGYHNFGLLTLISFLISVNSYFKLQDKKNFTQIVIFGIIAIYTHYVNLLIIPIFLLLTAISNLKTIDALKFKLKYSLVVSISLAPFLFLFAYRFTSLDTIEYAELSFFSNDNLINLLLDRTVNWFIVAIDLYGFLFFSLGFIGTILIFKQSNIAFFLILSHFILSLIISGFTDWAQIRVFIYLLPSLTIGTASIIKLFFFKKKYMTITGIVVGTLLIFFQINLILNEKKFLENNSLFNSEYFISDGNVRKAVQYIHALNIEPLHFNDYVSRDLLCSLAYKMECNYPTYPSYMYKKNTLPSDDFVNYNFQRGIPEDYVKNENFFIISRTQIFNQNEFKDHDLNEVFVFSFPELNCSVVVCIKFKESNLRNEKGLVQSSVFKHLYVYEVNKTH